MMKVYFYYKYKKDLDPPPHQDIFFQVYHYQTNLRSYRKHKPVLLEQNNDKLNTTWKKSHKMQL